MRSKTMQTIQRLSAVAVLSALTAASACAQQAPGAAVAALSQRFPCRPFSFQIVHVNRVAPAAACSAVVAAVDQVARGNARTFGIVPGDTAKISAAWVAFFNFNEIGGTSSDAYWSVSLAVTGHRMTINVRVLYALDSIVVTKGERPAPSGPGSPR